MSERKQGIVRTRNEKRGFGIVRVRPESSFEKYFLHVNNIRSGTASPENGSKKVSLKLAVGCRNGTAICRKLSRKRVSDGCFEHPGCRFPW